ncbi:hypothetical protein BLNAU_20941 [Blattamonas nauphoetae]|nr:hypothetical protein BLNAU_20941 [Blattamonas nauphoetae]
MSAPLVAVTPLLFAERSKCCISIVNRSHEVTVTDESVWAVTCDNNWTEETSTDASEMDEEAVEREAGGCDSRR